MAVGTMVSGVATPRSSWYSHPVGTSPLRMRRSPEENPADMAALRPGEARGRKVAPPSVDTPSGEAFGAPWKIRLSLGYDGGRRRSPPEPWSVETVVHVVPPSLERNTPVQPGTRRHPSKNWPLANTT